MQQIILFVVIIVIIFGAVWYSNQSEGYSGYPGFPSHYSQLGCGYNSPLFSPLVAKRCSGGPYMYSSNPYLKAICEGVSNSELAQVSCGKAFHGRPAHFDYSALSNGAWSNALCNCNNSTSALCTL